MRIEGKGIRQQGKTTAMKASEAFKLGYRIGHRKVRRVDIAVARDLGRYRARRCYIAGRELLRRKAYLAAGAFSARRSTLHRAGLRYYR